jgi:hypothetical protein
VTLPTSLPALLHVVPLASHREARCVQRAPSFLPRATPSADAVHGPVAAAGPAAAARDGRDRGAAETRHRGARAGESDVDRRGETDAGKEAVKGRRLMAYEYASGNFDRAAMLTLMSEDDEANDLAFRAIASQGTKTVSGAHRSPRGGERRFRGNAGHKPPHASLRSSASVGSAFARSPNGGRAIGSGGHRCRRGSVRRRLG